MSLAETAQRLDRRLPGALIAALAVQTAGALFWAGSAAERIATLERAISADQAAIQRVAVLEEQIGTMRKTLDRIEIKLDRAHGNQP